MRKLRFSGFWDRSESRVDNRQEHQKWLKNPPIGLREKDLLQEIAFDERFPPDQPLERLVTHIVEIYRVQYTYREHYRKGEIKKGQLQHLITVDFNEEIQRLKGNKTEVVLERNVVVKLNEDTFIRRKKLQLTPPKTDTIQEASKYLITQFHEFLGNNIFYSFGVKMTAVKEKPLEFHINKHLQVNGIDLEKSKEVGRVVYYRNGSVGMKYTKT